MPRAQGEAAAVVGLPAPNLSPGKPGQPKASPVPVLTGPASAQTQKTQEFRSSRLNQASRSPTSTSCSFSRKQKEKKLYAVSWTIHTLHFSQALRLTSSWEQQLRFL